MPRAILSLSISGILLLFEQGARRGAREHTGGAGGVSSLLHPGARTREYQRTHHVNLAGTRFSTLPTTHPRWGGGGFLLEKHCFWGAFLI